MWITVVLGCVLVAAVIAYLYFGTKLELDLAIIVGLAIAAAATAIALAIVYAPQLF